MNAAASVPLLGVRGLALRAGRRLLVSDLSFEVRAGELWCLIGPNGSGKTSLLHALAGLREADTGTVELEGRLLAQWPLAEAAKARGLLPQTLHDAFGATAMEVVLMGRHPHLTRWAWEDAADRRVAQASLQAVDLAGFAARDVTTLSGGERQRVGIAALLAQDPRLLLLDEPVAHLDLHHQILVLERLRALTQTAGKAALLAIHDLNLARRFATHALVLGGAAPRLGVVSEVMTEAVLGDAFGHVVQLARVGAHTVYVPA